MIFSFYCIQFSRFPLSNLISREIIIYKKFKTSIHFENIHSTNSSNFFSENDLLEKVLVKIAPAGMFLKIIEIMN